MVGVGLTVVDFDKTGAEGFADGLLALDADVDLYVAMFAIEGVAQGEVELVVTVLPVFVVDLYYGAQGAVGEDALGARPYGLDVGRLVVGVAAEGAEGAGGTCPQDVVAIAVSEVLRGGVELGLPDLELLLALAVDVYRLAFVEVDAVGYQR